MNGDKPALVDWTYETGDKYYPGDEYVRSVRPQAETQPIADTH